MPRIYTKTGDDGTTGLLFGGRVRKDDLVTEAYGTTDEAVAALGLARALTDDEAIAADLLALQRELFVVGADLATNPEERDTLDPERLAGHRRHGRRARVCGSTTWSPNVHSPRCSSSPARTRRARRSTSHASIVRRAERAVVALERRRPRREPGRAASISTD